jgi:signal transduction histidine kinase
VNTLRQWRLSARIFATLALVLMLDFAVNAYLFERANTFSLPAGEAEVLGGQLLAIEREMDAAPASSRAGLARRLGGGALQIEWSAQDQAPISGIQLGNIEGQLLRVHPELAPARLQVFISPLRVTDGLTGTLMLVDGSVMRFRSHTHSVWPLVIGHLVNFLLPTTAFALLAWLLTYAALRPLRKLVRASLRVGTRRAQPIDVAGPVEVQLLIRAFNSMQQRIDALLDANTQTLLAIAHDLRTPLTRMQLRLDAMAMEEEDRLGLESDMGEIRDLLSSLQSFVELESDEARREPVDLAAMAQTLVDSAEETHRSGGRASYHGPDHLVVYARSLALRRAIGNLVENALNYGGCARLSLAGTPFGVSITVEDDGPGIPPEELDKVLQPFVRLDHARERNTSGMGLGLAIVERAIQAERGTLTLANRSTGGLRATIRLPQSCLEPASATLSYN